MATQKYAWVIGVMCFCAGIVTMGGITIFGYCLLAMADTYGVTAADMAIVSSLYTLMSNGLAFVMGIVNQKTGPRLLMGCGMLGNGLMVLIIGLFVDNLGAQCSSSMQSPVHAPPR